MAPIEFEKELKKHLRSREVRPSAEAWQRIASRLDDEDPGQGRNPRWWMGLVAASIMLLAALTFFWEQPEPLPGDGPVVGTPAGEILVEEPGPELKPMDLIREPKEAILVATSEKEESKPSVLKEESKSENLQAPTQQLAEASPEEPFLSAEESDQISGLLAAQMDTIFSTVVAIEEVKEPVSDAQVEALLREAQQSILIQGGTEDRSSLEPSFLLAQAEDELDQTFREQILEKLRKEYTRIRNSVADRNK